MDFWNLKFSLKLLGVATLNSPLTYLKLRKLEWYSSES